MIVDDDPEAIEVLSDYIQKVPILSLQKITTDPIKALAILEEIKPDIIFLDVEMPELSGFDFLESLKANQINNLSKIILTTGHEKYAITGYDHSISGYLLKPISFKRFKVVVDRVVVEIRKNKNSFGKEDFLFLDVGGKKIKVNFREILYIEAAGNYVFIITSKDRLMIHKTMNVIQDLLPEKDFIRVHKSYISSISHIKEIHGNEIFFTSEKPEKKILFSNTYKENLLKKLKIN
jgi:two-component system LytT family response regulator